MAARPTLTALVRWAGLAALAMAAALPAQATEPWPSRPLKLIVPFPPGGAADAVGRLYAERLGRLLKQPVLIDNKPGAGSAIGGDIAAKAAPDGHTLSLAPAGQLTVVPHIQKPLGYDPLKDFAPVSTLAQVSYVIAAQPSLPVSGLADLVRQAKARPGQWTYSSCGNGTLCNLTGELLKLHAGIDLLHVPYKGSAPAVTALLGGEVNLASDTLTVLAPQVKAGKLKGLAITSRERSPLLPDVPTTAEAGLPQVESTSWFGLVVPAATPQPIVARLSALLAEISREPELRQRLAQQGLETLNSSPEQFAALIRADHAKWGQIVLRAGIRGD
ncbi:MAG: tripartite tricarboxylate transporter substrate binding protein [Burkholderiaceae bacterium]|nr:tripartite tricarboxylate transporter substrate binding protein [Burkholderiaceae bacterium]